MIKKRRSSIWLSEADDRWLEKLINWTGMTQTEIISHALYKFYLEQKAEIKERGVEEKENEEE